MLFALGVKNPSIYVDFQSVAAATVVGNSEYVLWSHASFASSYDCGRQYVGLPGGGFKKVALSFGVPSPMVTCGVIWPTPRTSRQLGVHYAIVDDARVTLRAGKCSPVSESTM